MRNPMIYITSVFAENDNDSRHTLKPKRRPQISQHTTRIPMSSMEYSIINRICNIRGHEQTVHATRRNLRKLVAHIPLVLLRAPNAERDLVNLESAVRAVQRGVELRNWPYDRPV